jgi:hypothetical protein
VQILDKEGWEEGSVEFWFQTAWSPPVPVLEQLSKDNPTVTISHRFVEEGMGFYGTYEYHKGSYEVIEENTFNDETPCEIWVRYKGDDYHHYCNECDNYFDCDGEPSRICAECEELLSTTEKELWEGDKDDCNLETQAS